MEWDAEIYFWSLQHMQLRDVCFMKASSSHSTDTELEANYLALISSCCSKISKIFRYCVLLFLYLPLGKSITFLYLTEGFLLKACHGSRWDYS